MRAFVICGLVIAQGTNFLCGYGYLIDGQLGPTEPIITLGEANIRGVVIREERKILRTQISKEGRLRGISSLPQIEHSLAASAVEERHA